MFSVRKTTRSTELKYPPLQQFAKTDKDYLQLLKEKLKFIAGILLGYSAQQAQDRVLNALMYNKLNLFRRWFGIFVSITHIHHSFRQEQPNFAKTTYTH